MVEFLSYYNYSCNSPEISDYKLVITLPPAMGRKAPVINPARSEARKQTAFAVSASVPRRPIGT